jgi:serine/threonine-protein kinase
LANLVGQTLGQYHITALLGAGGMATVYRAHQESIERDVAIKVILPNLGEQGNFLERFRREAKTVASLSHPHILKIFDYGQYEGMAYLVMELLSGGSLADLIRKGPLSLETTGRMLDQVASALDFAHQQGIVHRDLKPQNVLLDNTGNTFLADFGIAKIVESEGQLTQSGAVMGTPAYMSPEQWSGQVVDSRADVYALGVMLFEMLTGKLPFVGNTPFALMHQHIYETARSVNEVNENVPSALAPIVNRALAKNREERFSTAGELAAAFRAVLNGVSPSELNLKPIAAPNVRLDDQTVIQPPKPPTLPEAQQPASRTTRWLVPLGLVLIGIIGVGFFLSQAGHSNSIPTPTLPPSVAPTIQGNAPTAIALAATTSAPTATSTEGSTNTPRPTVTPSLTPSLTATIDEEETLNAVVLLTATNIQRSTQLAATISARLTQTEQAKPTLTYTPSRTPTETPLPTETPTDTPPPTETNTPRPTFTPSTVPTLPPTATVKGGLATITLEFGSEGTGTGKFDDLRYVTVDESGNIYTGEYSSGRIQKFDATGKYLTSWIPDSKTPLRGLTVDRNGNVYVVRQGKVLKFDSDGKLLKTFGGTFSYYDDVTLLPDGNLLVAATSAASDDIVKVNASSGTESNRIKSAISSQSDQAELDMRLAVDGLGNIYALGSFNRAVFVFSAAGKFQNRFGEFESPDGITVDGQGNIYVSDFGEIKVFNKVGQPIGSIAVPNRQNFQIAITADNDLFIAARDRVYQMKINLPEKK